MLFNKEMSLSMNEKYYIAIMAASSFESESLLNIIEEQFINLGGNPDWLINGITSAGQKMTALSELNELLAFKPWLIEE